MNLPTATHDPALCGVRRPVMSLAMSVDQQAESFVHAPHKLLIDGEWVEAASGQTFATINPATAETLAEVAHGQAEDIERAVRAARRAFDDDSPWRRMNASDRGRIIWRISELIEEHADELAMLECLDNGKPYTVARAADVPLAADLFRYMAGWPTKIHGSTVPISALPAPGEYLAYTLREPVGVVGQIIPWNFPLLMAAWKLGPVLACGCTTVLKPAEQTPLSALRLGKLIVHAAAGNLKKVSLELGGKSPNVVYADADLESAIVGAANGIFFNHGQCCNAGSRLYVQKDAYDDVVAGVADFAKGIKVRPGTDPESSMGPLISDEQFQKVLGYLDAGQAAGAEVVVGGGRAADRGYFVQPTILANTSNDMSVVREEIFGPVVCAIPFDSADEIVPVANDTNYGLAAGVFTRDISKAHKTAARLRAGTVWINTYHIFDAAMPFGGYKESGWGREMGPQVLENYLETKSVVTAL